MLYVVEIPGYAKIGYAKDPERRLREYQRHNPLVVRFFHVCDGEVEDEKLLQGMAEIAGFKRVGMTEWFEGATGADFLVLVTDHHMRKESGEDDYIARSVLNS